jgi:ABC-type phosphate transport system substrate-binding protein
MRKTTTAIIVALLLLNTLRVRADGDKPEPMAIVVKKGSKLTALTSAELLKIFKGQEKQSDDGTKFALTMRATGSAERAAFLDQVMKMSESEYQKYFLQAVFTGMVKVAPKAVGSIDALKAFMDSNDGAIGYVKLGEVGDNFTVVSIDGKKPGESGYPLNTK